jgi:uncharacterized membrane protein YecN with MAPEG domain
MILQTTLSLAAAAALINIWLGIRCAQVRAAEKILVGDGGNARMISRMRAHSNFTENAPLTLILIAVIELTGKGAPWLAYVGALFMLGRVCHGLGMDRDTPNGLRAFGAISSTLTQLGLAIVAVLIALGVM